MKQYDVYAVPGRAAEVSPYVVVLTSHHISLRLVLVAPLLSDAEVIEAADVPIHFESVGYVLSLMELAAVQPSALKRKVGSVADQEDVIRRTIDRLFTGF